MSAFGPVARAVRSTSRAFGTKPRVVPSPDLSTRSPEPGQCATLLVSCPDRSGLVAALAQLLTGHGANILAADQHRDAQEGHFFQRIHFDAGQLLTDRGTLERALDEVAERFQMQLRLHYECDRPRVAIFVSQYDHCLQDLVWRQRSGELLCDFPVIVSNREDLAPLASQLGIDFRVFPIDKENKKEQEQAELKLLADLDVDLVVLARYMQILTGEFLEGFPGSVINIHHSFLPAFAGGRPYHQAAARGVKLIGATAHYATLQLDEGPIIEQDVLRASHRDSVPDLTRKGRDVERTVLGRAVRWHLEHRVLVHGNRSVVFA